jgi:hypothetical protein
MCLGYFNVNRAITKHLLFRQTELPKTINLRQMPTFLRDLFSYGGRIKINDSFKDKSVGKNVKKILFV